MVLLAPQECLWSQRHEKGRLGRFMRVAGVLRAGVGMLLAGVLVLSAAPTASANDGARAAEWPLTAYDAVHLVWPHSTGKGVVVAVIDSGVRATHVDLTGQVLPGVDYLYGGNGETDHSTDGHGTGIASLIAGHGHGPGDEDGIMGLAPGAKILPVGVGSDARAANVAQGIEYAVNHGASVINMSLGAPGFDAEEASAIFYAESKNVVIVAAAGNSGTNEDDYPASFSGVVSVSGVDQSGDAWSGSTYGSHVVVAAPAVGIVRDGNGSDTQMYKGDGTSYSTAYVSAIAALIRSAYPSLTAGQVINMIIKGAALPTGLTAPDPHYGYGIARPDQWTLWATMAKNPGPASGPLPQLANPSTPTIAAPVGSSGSNDSAIALALLGGGLVVLLLIILLFVRVSRSRRRKREAADESAALPYQQQPYAQPAYQPATQPYAPPQQPGQPSYDPYGQLPQAPQQQPPNYQPPYGNGNGGGNSNGPYQG